MKLEMKVDIVFSTKIMIFNSGFFLEMSRVCVHSNNNTYVANTIFSNMHASTKIAPSSKLLKMVDYQPDIYAARH